eukprot:gene12553-15775_t
MFRPAVETTAGQHRRLRYSSAPGLDPNKYKTDVYDASKEVAGNSDSVLSRVELLSIKGMPEALHYSLETGWDLLAHVKEAERGKIAQKLKTSLILRASVDVIGVSSCLCVYAYTIAAMGVDSPGSKTKVDEGWFRIPLFVPFVSMKHQDDADRRLKLLVGALSHVAGISEDEIASKLDFIGMKQKDMRMYDILFKVYCRLYLGRVNQNVDYGLLQAGSVSPAHSAPLPQL